MSQLRRAAQPIFFACLLAVVFISSQVSAADSRHPCHPGSPGGPGVGPPCPPTPVPEIGGGEENQSAAGTSPVRFAVRNSTGERITVWLGDPILYVFNVDAGMSQTFVVPRDVYPYELSSCGVRSTGYLNLTLHSYLEVDPCRSVKLVRVDLVNDTGRPDIALGNTEGIWWGNPITRAEVEKSPLAAKFLELFVLGD